MREDGTGTRARGDDVTRKIVRDADNTTGTGTTAIACEGHQTTRFAARAAAAADALRKDAVRIVEQSLQFAGADDSHRTTITRATTSIQRQADETTRRRTFTAAAADALREDGIRIRAGLPHRACANGARIEDRDRTARASPTATTGESHQPSGLATVTAATTDTLCLDATRFGARGLEQAMIGNRHGATRASATASAGQGDQTARSATGTTPTADALREDGVGTRAEGQDDSVGFIQDLDSAAIAGFATGRSESNEATGVTTRTAAAANTLGDDAVRINALRLHFSGVENRNQAAIATHCTVARHGHQAAGIAAVTATAANTLGKHPVGTVTGRRHLTAVDDLHRATTTATRRTAGQTHQRKTAATSTTCTASAEGLNAVSPLSRCPQHTAGLVHHGDSAAISRRTSRTTTTNQAACTGATAAATAAVDLQGGRALAGGCHLHVVSDRDRAARTPGAAIATITVDGVRRTTTATIAADTGDADTRRGRSQRTDGIGEGERRPLSRARGRITDDYRNRRAGRTVTTIATATEDVAIAATASAVTGIDQIHAAGRYRGRCRGLRRARSTSHRGHGEH